MSRRIVDPTDRRQRPRRLNVEADIQLQTNVEYALPRSRGPPHIITLRIASSRNMSEAAMAEQIARRFRTEVVNRVRTYNRWTENRILQRVKGYLNTLNIDTGITHTEPVGTAYAEGRPRETANDAFNSVQRISGPMILNTLQKIGPE